MSLRKRGLGRGLDALIGGSAAVTEEASAAKKEAEEERTKAEAGTASEDTGKAEAAQTKAGAAEQTEASADGRDQVVTLDIDKIKPDTKQPRQVFDQDRLEELTASIKEHGVLQPLIVKKVDDGYQIIAGERRYRAAKAAGIDKLPVLVREYTQQETLEVSLIENIQRQDLNPIEEAKAFQRLMDEYGLKQEEVAQKVGRSRSSVANSLRLLNLSDDVQWMIADGSLSTGHAKVLLGIRSKELQEKLAKKAAAGQWSVRQLEKEAKKALLGKPAPVEPTAVDKAYQQAGEQLQEILGTKVRISYKEDKGVQKGKIEIDYYSEEELERLIGLIQSLR